MTRTKTIKQSAKRKNLTEEEIILDLKRKEKIAHMKDVVRTVFPELESVDTIYDAQTVVNALSGFIMAHVESKIGEIKLSDIVIDLSKEEDSKIKTSMVSLIEKLQDEPAKELASTLDRLGRTFAEFGANKFLKQSMGEITITDILA